MLLLRLTAAAAASLIAATAAAASGPAVAPQKNWASVRSPNFHVVGDAGDRSLRAVAMRLEQFREALSVVIPKAVAVTTEPVTVIVFRNHRAFDPFKPLYEGRTRKDVAGFFLRARAMNYIALAAESEADYSIIYHEYVHFVERSVLSAAPLWYSEGLAEFFSAFDGFPGAKRARLGKPQAHHVFRLREQWLPLLAMTASDHESPYYNEGDKSSVFYAESWLLVHYLLLGDDQKYFPRSAEFVHRLVQGASFEAACADVLQTTPAALERRLRQYAQQEAFHQLLVNFSEGIAKLESLPVERVPDSEAHATLGSLLQAMGRPDEAHGQFEAALALDPESAAAHAGTGELLLEAKQPERARAHLERAVASSGATWLTHFKYAVLLRGSDDHIADVKTRGSVERALRRTIELNPELAEAYAELAWLKAQDPASRPEALKLAHTALTKMPGSERYAFLIASLLAMSGEDAPARAILSRLTRASDERVRRASDTLLKNIEGSRREGAGGTRDEQRAASAERPSGRGTFVPALRTLRAGEQRIKARLTAIECTGGRVTLALTVNDRPATVKARDFEEIEFITYREDLTGQVQCGPRGTPEAVLITYRPDPATAAEGAIGDAVAVEFPPDDYVE